MVLWITNLAFRQALVIRHHRDWPLVAALASLSQRGATAADPRLGGPEDAEVSVACSVGPWLRRLAGALGGGSIILSTAALTTRAVAANAMRVS